MFNIVLVSPEIPPNTGNVIRLSANTGCRLHLIRPLGFSLEDRLLRRAGLDYREYAQICVHDSWEQFLRTCSPMADRMFGFTSHAATALQDIAFLPGDWLVFGCESRGLDPALLQGYFPSSRRVRIPMRPGNRSLNLSNAVAVGVFEAWRQNQYQGAQGSV